LLGGAAVRDALSMDGRPVAALCGGMLPPTREMSLRMRRSGGGVAC
jgi:hypothetical protein